MCGNQHITKTCFLYWGLVYIHNIIMFEEFIIILKSSIYYFSRSIVYDEHSQRNFTYFDNFKLCLCVSKSCWFHKTSGYPQGREIQGLNLPFYNPTQLIKRRVKHRIGNPRGDCCSYVLYRCHSSNYKFEKKKYI